MSVKDNFIKLFHGSKSGLTGKICPTSRKLCDFGKGFYMGTEKSQPMTLVCNYDNSIVYELKLNTNNLIIKDIPLDLNWAMFVAFNRGRLTEDVAPELFKKFDTYKKGIDIFKGYIANDRMFVVLDRFFDGEITDVALVKCLSALKLGIQYVAVTQKAFDAITIIREEKITDEQKADLAKKSDDNRNLGISLAEDICKKHRREGKFFDELIH